MLHVRMIRRNLCTIMLQKDIRRISTLMLMVERLSMHSLRCSGPLTLGWSMSRTLVYHMLLNLLLA